MQPPDAPPPPHWNPSQGRKPHPPSPEPGLGLNASAPAAMPAAAHCANWRLVQCGRPAAPRQTGHSARPAAPFSPPATARAMTGRFRPRACFEAAPAAARVAAAGHYRALPAQPVASKRQPGVSPARITTPAGPRPLHASSTPRSTTVPSRPPAIPARAMSAAATAIAVRHQLRAAPRRISLHQAAAAASRPPPHDRSSSVGRHGPCWIRNSAP